MALLGDTERRGIGLGERGLHRRGQRGLLVLAVGVRPLDAENLAGHGQHPVLADARPEHLGGRPHVRRELDVEACDGGFELGPGVRLERELAVHRAGDAGGEQALLVRLGQCPERREGLPAVLDLQPVEAEGRTVGQHGLARAPVAEGVVVDAERRPVRGLAHCDVERMVVIAGGEHRAPHLEQHQVEGGPEVIRQVGLDQRRAASAEVVGEADADTGLLARLGLRVGPRGRHGRAGDRGGLDAGGGLLAVILPATGMRGGARRGGVGIGRHVLGLHQPLDELQLAVAADGDDAARDGNVLGLEDGAGLDGVLDLLEARLDRLGLLDQLVGPRVLVHVDELVVAGVQPLDLGLLFVGGLGRRGTHAPEAGEVGPLDVETGLGPLPPRRELVGGHLEPVQGELHQQRRVLQPDAVLVLVGEEIAQHGAAGGLVGVHANVAGERGAGGNPVIGEHALDLPAGWPVALVLDLLPHRHLACGVGGDGEGLEGLEVDGVLPVGVQQLRRGVAEAEALLDGALGDAEAGGDVGDGGAGERERAEGLDLVGRVHGDPDRVLGERELGVAHAVLDDAAGHGEVGSDGALAGEVVQRGEPAGAGDDGEVFAVVLTGTDGAGHEVLEQAVGGDGCLELGECGLAGLGPADVGGRGLQAVEGDGSDDGFGHRLLRRWAARRRRVDGGRAAACSRARMKRSRGRSLGRTGLSDGCRRARPLRDVPAGSDGRTASRCSGSRRSRRRRSRRRTPRPRRTGRGGRARRP